MTSEIVIAFSFTDRRLRLRHLRREFAGHNADTGFRHIDLPIECRGKRRIRNGWKPVKHRKNA
jgi:hypothetical protein